MEPRRNSRWCEPWNEKQKKMDDHPNRLALLVARWSSGKCIVWLPRRYGYPIVVDYQAKEKKIGNQSAQTVYHDWQFGSDCITKSRKKLKKSEAIHLQSPPKRMSFHLLSKSRVIFIYFFLLPLSIASVGQGSDWVARHPRRCFLSKGGRHV